MTDTFFPDVTVYRALYVLMSGNSEDGIRQNWTKVERYKKLVTK